MSDVEPLIDQKIKVLIHESDQIHDIIGRTLGTANALYGLVLPGTFAVLAFTAKSDLHFPRALLAFGFAGVIAATLIYNAGLWLELSKYIRFKYTVVYPQLHTIARIARRDNLGIFIAREYRRGTIFATVAFQAVALSVTSVVVGTIFWVERANPWTVQLAVLTAILLVVALSVTAAAARVVRANISAMLNSTGNEVNDEQAG